MAEKAKNIVPPKQIRVRKIRTDELEPNPHNPRILFDQRPMEILEKSIRKVGILVPLTVYHDSQIERYVILDGQRRWICAQKIGLNDIPVNEIEEPDEVQNIVTMFQIHKFREDWELMPTALKLEVLMEKLEERGEKALAELTGLDGAVVSRCKKLLTYPKKYQDMMLFQNPEDRIKADFFIELHAILSDISLKKMKWGSRDKITEMMLYKYQNKLSGFKSVTDFRKIKQHFVNSRKAGKVSILESLFREFMESDELNIGHLEIVDLDVRSRSNRLVKDITKLIDALSALDAREFFGEEGLWLELEKLLKLTQRKLQQADRRVE